MYKGVLKHSKYTKFRVKIEMDICLVNRPEYTLNDECNHMEQVDTIVVVLVKPFEHLSGICLIIEVDIYNNIYIYNNYI